ncbi:endogenous retrovirus group K member 18 Pro protein-like [Dasypus novemcinctus]|uniref:endogenous retrovirus group K member 18 Pro protein-like n=1 Tax=Dasypus novemcinctus TaxID=9361 RepID=UPI00062AAC18|nr:endogenous retrovirus group K member 18 Pro protein-like [Dasypus novemcinctus]
MWTVPIRGTKPLMELKVEGQWLEGLLDSGAEISCILFEIATFNHWALEQGPQVIGATGSSNSWRCATAVKWEDREGRHGHFHPLILSTVSNILWGRDILEQTGAILTTAASTVQKSPQY